MIEALPAGAALEHRIRSAERLSLFLDFDGTLSPIVADPGMAQLGMGIHSLLTALARAARITTTVISGRSVEDLYARIGVDGLIYAGNHGLEICGRHLTFVEPVAA